MNKLPKTLAKNVTVDMKVTTDDLVNIHIAKIESELLAKQKQYEKEFKEATVDKDNKFELLSALAIQAAQDIINRIPKELSVEVTVDKNRSVMVSKCQTKVFVELQYSKLIGRNDLLQRAFYSIDQEVKINNKVIDEYLACCNKIKQIYEKLSAVSYELRNLDKRTRHVRAEISKRKLTAAGDISALIDLTDSTDTMLSLPKDL